MERIIIDRNGKVIAGPSNDQTAIVAAGKAFVKSGNVEVKVFLSDARGSLLGYDQKNTALVFKR
jgi:hypothetical protein